MFESIKNASHDWITDLKRRQCDFPSCRRWISHGQLRSRGVGVQMGDSWYCSYDCFRPVVMNELTPVVGGRHAYSSSKPSLPLGLALIGRDLLTADQLRYVNDMSSASNLDAGDLFVQNGFVTEAQVAAARATIWGCPVYNPSNSGFRCDIHIPPALTAFSRALPVHYVPATRQLLIGFLREVDYVLMSAIEAMTGCTTKACFIKPSAFYLHEERIRNESSHTSGSPTEMTFNTVYSAGERARILCNYGAGVNADRVKITACKDYLWARLQGDSGICDLLFKAA